MPFKKILARKKYNPGQPQTPRYYRSMVGGTSVNEYSSMQVAAYYRGVIYVTGQMAKLPLDIKNEAKEKQMRNRVYKLLNKRPNPEMTAFTFKQLMGQLAINKGNGYAEIERDGAGRPVALWPLKSDHVQPRRDSNNKLIYKIIGGHPSGNGDDTYLLPQDIFHLKNFHSQDGIEAESTIAFAAESLGVSLGAEKFSNGLWANSGIPSGVIQVKGKLSPEGAKNLKAHWSESVGGRKTGGTAVLDDGAEYKPLILQPDQLQFLETKKFSVPQIARFLGVPPTKLYDTEASKYKNVEQDNLGVVIDTLDMWAKNWENEIDVKLLGFNSTMYSEMDLYAIFRGDMETRATYYTKMMQVGAITPNQIRAAEGQPSYEGGDRYYIATNNYTPADRVDEVIDSQVNKSDNINENNDDAATEAVVNYLVRKTGN